MTQTFTIASWNVNSVRMRAPLVERWLRDHAVDVLLLQELKALEEQCPVSLFEEAGYNSAIFWTKKLERCGNFGASASGRCALGVA